MSADVDGQYAFTCIKMRVDRCLSRPDRIFYREYAIVAYFRKFSQKGEIGRACGDNVRSVALCPRHEFAVDERHYGRATVYLACIENGLHFTGYFQV